MRQMCHTLIRSRQGQAATLLVLLYGSLLGYFVWYTFVAYFPRTYPVQWQAPWISYPGEEVHQSYYRKILYLPQEVVHAWMQVMAPDSFTVYVNSKPLETGERLADNITAYIDLTSALVPGTNVIAILASRSTFPGTSKIAVAGGYEEAQGITHKILSDASWRVTRYEDWQRLHGPQWFEPTFDDKHWQHAQVIGIPQSQDHSKVSYNPLMYTEKLPRQWIWAPETTAHQVYFRYSINLPMKPKDGWIRLTANRGYYLSVNGIAMGKNQARTGINSNVLPRFQHPLDIYNITPFLKAGPNTIAISAVGEQHDRGLLVDGMILDHASTTRWIVPPADWKTSTVASAQWTAPAFDDSLWLPAQTKGFVPLGEQFPKAMVAPEPPASYYFTVALQKMSCVLITGFFTVLLWLLVGTLIATLQRIALAQAFIQTSLMYALPLLLLTVCLLIGYDLRYDQTFSFRREVIFANGILVFFTIILFCFRVSISKASVHSAVKHSRYTRAIIVTAIVVLGFFLRLHHIDYRPLGGDEVTMTLVSQKVLEKGYPVVDVSPSLKEKIMTTSEIIPYIFALSLKLFASQSIEFGLRFPGVVFGMMVIVLIYLTGKTLFDTRVGILAATLYAILPVAISFSQFARYPTPMQFFALLSAYLLYRSFEAAEPNHKYLFCSTISCILTYLSWEGTLLYLPALCLGLVCMKGKDTRWMKDPYFLLGLVALCLTIFLQLSFRMLLNMGTMVLGSGISDINLTVRREQPLYEPFVFIYDLFLLKNIAFLSIFVAMGIPAAIKNKALLYCYCLIAIPLIITTNTIEVQDTRHVYYVVPFIILVASVIFLDILDFLFIKKNSALSVTPFSFVGSLTKMGFIALLICTANDYILKLYYMPLINPATWHDQRFHKQTLLEFGSDRGIRGVIEVIKREGRPGDKIISVMPHMVYFYMGKKDVDFYIEPRNIGELQIPVLVDQYASKPLHRITGAQLLYTPEEFKEALDKNSRVWIALSLRLTDFLPPRLNTLLGQTALVFEDQDVRLYLWKR